MQRFDIVATSVGASYALGDPTLNTKLGTSGFLRLGVQIGTTASVRLGLQACAKLRQQPAHRVSLLTREGAQLE